MQPLASHMVLFAVRLTKSESDMWIGGLKSCSIKSGTGTASSNTDGFLEHAGEECFIAIEKYKKRQAGVNYKKTTSFFRASQSSLLLSLPDPSPSSTCTQVDLNTTKCT